MPIFEYVCRDCDHEFELLVRGDETPQCESCHGKRLSKLLSVPAGHSSSAQSAMPSMPAPGTCGMGGCGRPECDF